MCDHYSAAFVVHSEPLGSFEASEITPATISFREWRNLVSDAAVLQYVGFEDKGTVREYTFTLRGSGGKSCEYFVSIANAAFVVRRVRYQDAPEICSCRLHREFAARADHPSTLFLSPMQNWPNT